MAAATEQARSALLHHGRRDPERARAGLTGSPPFRNLPAPACN